jgi:hypothetical protein
MKISSEEIAKMKFGKLKIKTPQEVSSGSGKKIEWICDCGRETIIQIRKVLLGHTKSCGHCKEISVEKISKMKFGKLRIKAPQNVLPWSGKKIEWVCDCGKTNKITPCDVLSGNTSSCGRCNEISAEEISNMKFGKLRVKIPKDILPGSHEKIELVCDCGRETNKQIYQVIHGYTTSCGLCKEISSEEISKMKFGKLRIKTPQKILPWSSKKTEWICDCGKETISKTLNIFSGNTSSCGHCKDISAEEMSKRKFGKLKIKTPQVIKHGSNKKIEWICDCGVETSKKISYVISGRTKSCGDCYGTVFNWYVKNKEKIRSLRCPIDSKDVPPGGIIPLETIKTTTTRFRTLCPACQKPWTALWADIRSCFSITCGCSYNRTSVEQRKIFEFIKIYDPNVQLEYKLGPFSYDIFVPSKNLLIEYDGEMWHSNSKTKLRDLRKHEFALDSRYKFMRILEKDWKLNKKETQNRIELNLI